MAFKIFELGLKKYGDIPEYILAYIDYLSHLNGRLCLVKCRVDTQNVGSIAVMSQYLLLESERFLNYCPNDEAKCVTLYFYAFLSLQRITTLGSCLSVSSPQEVCHQKSQGNDKF